MIKWQIRIEMFSFVPYNIMAENSDALKPFFKFVVDKRHLGKSEK